MQILCRDECLEYNRVTLSARMRRQGNWFVHWKKKKLLNQRIVQITLREELSVHWISSGAQRWRIENVTLRSRQTRNTFISRIHDKFFDHEDKYSQSIHIYQVLDVNTAWQTAVLAVHTCSCQFCFIGFYGSWWSNDIYQINTFILSQQNTCIRQISYSGIFNA